MHGPSESNEQLAVHGEPTLLPVSIIKVVQIQKLSGGLPLHPTVAALEGRQLAALLRRNLPESTLASLIDALQKVPAEAV